MKDYISWIAGFATVIIVFLIFTGTTSKDFGQRYECIQQSQEMNITYSVYSTAVFQCRWLDNTKAIFDRRDLKLVIQ